VVQRYRGRLEAYELWVMGNDSHYYTGSPETLVEMTRRASRIIRTVDPKAIVVCPSMDRLWEPDAQYKLQRFAELGGYNYCDVADVKFYARVASAHPNPCLSQSLWLTSFFIAAAFSRHCGTLEPPTTFLSR
jgi:hypothetical protein